jgi:hypothetical protein
MLDPKYHIHLVELPFGAREATEFLIEARS